MNAPLVVISLGAGVQSTTLALMAAHGEFEPAPSCAIFADTGWEPRRVYEHLAWLSSGNVLPFPVRKVQSGNIRDEQVRKHSTRSGRFAAVPWFTSTGGLGRRQCTSHYKVEPINAELRRLVGVSPRGRMKAGAVELWIGISTDEAWRVKPARQQWLRRRWPLIERGMSRWDCSRWLERRGYPVPPKSSCIGCPYHNNAHWRDMKDNDPEAWRDAVEIDGIIRDGGSGRGLRLQQFMHRSLVPLAEADLSTAAERGQGDLFGNECEGLCGV